MSIYNKIKTEIEADYFQQNFPNDGQRFVAWYLRNILFRDMIETKDDITDGPDDKQIDAVVVDNDRQIIHILQGKYLSGESVDAEPLRETVSSWLQIRDLVRLQEVGNQKLQRKLAEVAHALEEDYEVSFELITTGVLTDAAKADLETFQRQLSELSDADNFDATISVIDRDELTRRYDFALEADNPAINFSFDLTHCKYMNETIAGTQVVIAAIPLKECIKMPGIKDGTLFQKNVRQSLGLSNAVNKGIKQTIVSEDKHRDFFFFHNGITALCNKMKIENGQLRLHGLSVVNGCQSLNTILSCSEIAKKRDDSFVLFRFYEIPQRDRADRISISTNSQSVVRPRDLRSNDKRVLTIKKSYETKFPRGYFVTKRGEQAPADRDKNQVVDLAEFAKCLIAWHSQRPNLSYGETKIFDKYFETLFKNKEYEAEDVAALNTWMTEVYKVWTKDNPIGLNETLLAMRAYAPYHHLYAIGMCFSIANNFQEKVPSPKKTLIAAKRENYVPDLVRVAGLSLNMALEAAANEPLPPNRVFSPQNWVKAKACLAAINSAIRNYFSMLPMMPGGPQIKQKVSQVLKLESGDFEYRWSAD